MNRVTANSQMMSSSPNAKITIGHSATVLSLRDSPTLGLFRLAWLETLLRSADAEGSKRLT